jgi:hypothetical protein
VKELEKFLHLGFPKDRPPVTFALYTGQEDEEEKEKIRSAPPDILLTNFVMLELLLTRPRERKTLIEAARDLRFLVLDELHTYRGRQGADVALLMRRTREATQASRVQFVGTSATLAGEGSFDDRRREVARVASLLFGDTVHPEHVIGETLKRLTPPRSETDQELVVALANRPAKGEAEVVKEDGREVLLVVEREGLYRLEIEDIEGFEPPLPRQSSSKKADCAPLGRSDPSPLTRRSAVQVIPRAGADGGGLKEDSTTSNGALVSGELRSCWEARERSVDGFRGDRLRHAHGARRGQDGNPVIGRHGA